MEMVWRLRETHSLMNNMIVCLTIWIILKNKCKKEMNSSMNKSNYKNMALNNRSKSHKKNKNKSSQPKNKNNQSPEIKHIAFHSSKRLKNLNQHSKNRFVEE